MEYQKFTGKDINEAITNACNTLGVMSLDIEYKILSEGNRGIFSKELAVIEARKKDLNKQSIKNIDDKDLKDFDLVKCFCNKCNKNTLFKVIFAPEGIVGECCKCKKYVVLKKDENYVPPVTNSKPVVECPYCHSTNTKKISGLSKAGSVALWGIFAAGKVSKQWHCNNCNSDF